MCCGSIVCCRWHNRRKLPIIVMVTVVAGLFLSCGFTSCFLHISRYNYPGGQAFSKLHSLINASQDNSLSGTCKQSMTTLTESVLYTIRAKILEEENLASLVNDAQFAKLFPANTYTVRLINIYHPICQNFIPPKFFHMQYAF